MVNFDEIRQAARENDLSGSAVCVHSSLKSFGWVDGGARTVVDGLLAENPTVPLLLFDEVLHKGFDGQNFIVGLSEHLRNLMVSQDARTVQLMEVPENIRKKYTEQSQAAAYSLLLSWLSIANQCDINYKMSKSQRLLVELALMKMAHLKSTFPGASQSPSDFSEPAPPAALKKKLK